MYGILFAATHKTLLKFSAGDRRLQGARLGILCKRDRGRQQAGQIRLGIIEFVRRFLQHILPEGFRKIRAYGFMASGWQQALEHARRLRSGGPEPPLDAHRCPDCHALLHYTLVSHPLFRLDGMPP